ncbi:MAG TPA: sigma-70 family RNA polymerase sigma factor [Planctomycetota bacterium]|nr:sigma-70 family RNA polymerase sigma factor [Planctomycetota bacterium]
MAHAGDTTEAEREAAWAREAAAGRRESFGHLVRRHEAGLQRYLAALVGSREEAEEIAQEALLRAWSRIDRYDPRWRFSTWLYTLARHLAVSRARRRDLPGSRVELESLGQTHDPRGALSRREEREGLWRLAERVLGLEQRDALWLFYAEGLSAEEIGRIQGRRAGTVRVALHRARAVLAEHLDPASGEECPARGALGRWDGALPAPVLEGGA